MDLWAGLRLQFDIDSDPPEPADLENLRRQVSPRNLQMMMLSGLAIGFALGAAFLDSIAWPLRVSAPLAVMIGLLATLPFMYWAKIADILAGVTHPLGREELSVFAEWSTRDERVAKYFDKILRQGRLPVYGDFAALVARVRQVSGAVPTSTADLRKPR